MCIRDSVKARLSISHNRHIGTRQEIPVGGIDVYVARPKLPVEVTDRVFPLFDYGVLRALMAGICLLYTSSAMADMVIRVLYRKWGCICACSASMVDCNS